MGSGEHGKDCVRYMLASTRQLKSWVKVANDSQEDKDGSSADWRGEGKFPLTRKRTRKRTYDAADAAVELGGTMLVEMDRRW